MLGITLGAVLLPAITHPEITVDLSFARFICTVIGVFVIALLSFWYLPKGPLDKLYANLKNFHDDLINCEDKGELVSRLMELEQRSHLMITLFSQRNLRNLYDNYFCECLEFLMEEKLSLLKYSFLITKSRKGLTFVSAFTLTSLYV